jgi:hypothetical protein
MDPVSGALLIGRNYPSYRLTVVAKPDGPVQFAMLAVVVDNDSSHGCVLGAHTLNQGKLIYSVLGDDAYGAWPKSKHKGGIGGPIDNLHPKVLVDYDDGLEDHWTASATRVYRLTGLFEQMTYDWDMKNPVLITSPKKDPEGLQIGGQPLAWGDNFFWTSDNLFTIGINSWNPVDGARPFIRYLGDGTRGAANLGTDGTTLVWSYGEGKKPMDDLTKFPVRSIMTAPFTTDPSKLAPKRLRSDPNIYMSGGTFRVACGYAANGGKAASQPLVVVRLKDGVSWVVPPTQPGFVFLEVLGITCDHVYAFMHLGGRYNIARIRLDSLGPGLPPD